MVLNLKFTIRILGYCYGNNTTTKISVGFFLNHDICPKVCSWGGGSYAIFIHFGIWVDVNSSTIYTCMITIIGGGQHGILNIPWKD